MQIFMNYLLFIIASSTCIFNLHASQSEIFSLINEWVSSLKSTAGGSIKLNTEYEKQSDSNWITSGCLHSGDLQITASDNLPIQISNSYCDFNIKADEYYKNYNDRFIMKSSSTISHLICDPNAQKHHVLLQQGIGNKTYQLNIVYIKGLNRGCTIKVPFKKKDTYVEFDGNRIYLYDINNTNVSGLTPCATLTADFDINEALEQLKISSEEKAQRLKELRDEHQKNYLKSITFLNNRFYKKIGISLVLFSSLLIFGYLFFNNKISR